MYLLVLTLRFFFVCVYVVSTIYLRISVTTSCYSLMSGILYLHKQDNVFFHKTAPGTCMLRKLVFLPHISPGIWFLGLPSNGATSWVLTGIHSVMVPEVQVQGVGGLGSYAGSGGENLSSPFLVACAGWQSLSPLGVVTASLPPSLHSAFVFP
jgi:hypothetical protein